MPVLHTQSPEILKMEGLHLFHAGLSNCSMRVRLLLDEKGLEWTSHPVDLGKQENLTDEYFRINPKGLVPALVDDGVPVTESADILFYLEEKFPQPSFTPDSTPDQAAMKEWVDQYLCTILATSINDKNYHAFYIHYYSLRVSLEQYIYLFYFSTLSKTFKRITVICTTKKHFKLIITKRCL